MPRFAFRLATLLKVREAARDERRQQLAEAYEALRLVDERLAELANESQNLFDHARRVAQPGVVDVDKLTDATRYGLLLRAQTQSINAQRERVFAETERRRELLVESERQVRTLEKLRDHQLAEFQFAEEKRQSNLLDEAALVRESRKGGRS